MPKTALEALPVLQAERPDVLLVNMLEQTACMRIIELFLRLKQKLRSKALMHTAESHFTQFILLLLAQQQQPLGVG